LSGDPESFSSKNLSPTVRIINREQKYTSRRAAARFVERGLAAWTDQSCSAIRFLEREQQFQARLARQEERYWRSVAAQRGGKEVFFLWKASMNVNGYVVMGATPIAIRKSARA
jgi:hypothetical protein